MLSASAAAPAQGWLLTRAALDGADGLELHFWLATPAGARQVVVTGQEAVFFLAAADAPRARRLLEGHPGVGLRALSLEALHGGAVAGVYSRSRGAWRAARQALEAAGMPLFEADVAPEERYLMERFVTGQVRLDTAADGQPRLRPAPGRPAAADLAVLSLDIETDWRSDTLLSVALVQQGRGAARAWVGVVREPGHRPLAETPGVQVVADEAALLRATLATLADFDPDLLTGWNLVGFDLRVLEARCRQHGLRCSLGRDGSPLQLVRSRGLWGERLAARLAGRVVLDGVECLRSAGWRFDSFSLEAVSRQLLGRGKAIDHVANRAPEILRMYRDAPAELVRYNREDAQLVLDVLAHTAVLDLVLERVRLTGLPMARWSGSVAAFDHLYLPRLHRAGRVAPAAGSGETGGSPGGHVLASRPGLYRDVLVLDFKSLYPSIIRSFLIDPLGLAVGLAAGAAADTLPGFRGARFARDGALLPQIIEELWAARDAARRDGDAPLAQAVKLLMNSFYGVLGTPLCRFFDARLASSITLRGHQVLTESQGFIEARGVPVIYGDTDSLFVHLPDAPSVAAARAEGDRLAGALNDWWRQRLLDELGVRSCLEIEFETHYLHFLMPRVRGADAGSKKRYAGLVQRHPEAAPGSPQAAATALVFKGLESVRSDWSPLARDFQRALYSGLFAGEPLQGLVRDTVAGLLAGQRDADLVLRRRLRKPLEEYTANVPPHVRAARSQVAAERAAGVPVSVQRGGWVDFVMTVNGPEPAAWRRSAIDHGFYLERQLKPVADAALGFIGSDFETLLGRQPSLF